MLNSYLVSGVTGPLTGRLLADGIVFPSTAYRECYLTFHSVEITIWAMCLGGCRHLIEIVSSPVTS